MYQLFREQVVPTDLITAWDFIQSPANLNRITPPDMDFQILTDIPHEMYNGLMIEYLVKIPLIGKQRWISEIKHIRQGQSFVDEQRLGPYKMWYHYHEIAAVENGVKFIDRVYYRVPFGILCRIVHAIFIKRTLERIFVNGRIKLYQKW